MPATLRELVRARPRDHSDADARRAGYIRAGARGGAITGWAKARAKKKAKG